LLGFAQQQQPDLLNQLFGSGGFTSNPVVRMVLSGILAYVAQRFLGNLGSQFTQPTSGTQGYLQPTGSGQTSGSKETSSGLVGVGSTGEDSDSRGADLSNSSSSSLGAGDSGAGGASSSSGGSSSGTGDSNSRDSNGRDRLAGRDHGSSDSGGADRAGRDCDSRAVGDSASLAGEDGVGACNVDVPGNRSDVDLLEQSDSGRGRAVVR